MILHKCNNFSNNCSVFFSLITPLRGEHLYQIMGKSDTPLIKKIGISDTDDQGECLSFANWHHNGTIKFSSHASLSLALLPAVNKTPSFPRQLQMRMKRAGALTDALHGQNESKT